MAYRKTDVVLMNLVKQILGWPEGQGTDNPIRFFMRDVPRGYGASRLLVHEIIVMNGYLLEGAALVGWMEYRARTDSTPKLRQDIDALKEVFEGVNEMVLNLPRILQIPVEERFAAVRHVGEACSEFMAQALRLNYPALATDTCGNKIEPSGVVVGSVVDERNNADVCLKNLVCDLGGLDQHSGMAPFLFWRSDMFVLRCTSIDGKTVQHGFFDYRRIYAQFAESFAPRDQTYMDKVFVAIYDTRFHLAHLRAFSIEKQTDERGRFSFKKVKEVLKATETELLAFAEKIRKGLRKETPKLGLAEMYETLRRIVLRASEVFCPNDPHWLRRGAKAGPPELCETCQAPGCNPGVNLRACSCCKNVAYCCAECQAEDWQEHKKVCRPPVVPSSAKKSTTSEVLACANCAATGNDGVFLRSCTVCKLVFYCSRACQAQHWKGPSGHKNFCVAKAARVPDAAKAEAGAAAAEEPDAEDRRDCCAVCLCELKSEGLKTKDTAELRCGHVLHAECLKTYACMSESKTCPICRASL
jgi:hypothetical protein